MPTQIEILNAEIARLNAEKKQIEDAAKVEVMKVLPAKVQELQKLLHEVRDMASQARYSFELKLETTQYSPESVSYDGYSGWRAHNLSDPNWESSSYNC